MKAQFLTLAFFQGNKMRDQVLTPKHLMLLFVPVFLTYGVEGIRLPRSTKAG